MGPLLIRADASVAMGTGHVMRCLALAQAWQDAGGEAFFVATEMLPAIESRLKAERCGVLTLAVPAGGAEDSRATAGLAARLGAAWVVADGYVFGASYYLALKASGLRVLAVDDYGHAESYQVDILLNQNGQVEPRLYEGRAPGVQLLLGSRYVLLRREFGRYLDWRRDVSAIAQRVLITMGGSDPGGVTLTVVRAIQSLGTVIRR